MAAAERRCRDRSRSPNPTIQEPLYDPPTEDDLVRALISMGDWYTVGLKLGVPTYELDRIKSLTGSFDDKKREMFRVWLLGIEDPTWKDILDVLKELNISKALKIVERNYDPTRTRPPPVIIMPKLARSLYQLRYTLNQAMSPLSIFCTNFAFTLHDLLADEKPTMNALQCLPTGDRKLKVVESIAAKWENVAYHLKFGVSQVQLIERQNHYRPLESCQEMFTRWLTGSGRQPVTWHTLIEALEDAQFDVLASDLNAVLESDK